MYNITSAQLEELIRFASDDRQPASTEALTALNALYSAVQRNTLRHLEGARKRNAMLTEKLSKLTERKEEAFEAGEFEETGTDSVDVARALLYQLQQLSTYKLDKYKLNAILYEMYASWLHSHKQWLFLEHPVATPFGPRFWRVYNHVEPSVSVPYQTWKAFAEGNPPVAAFCKRAAEKYYDVTESSLTRMFMSSKAYKNATKEHNNGKWNKEIEDKDIFTWKKELKIRK